jgi:hypothetical protein
MSGFRSLVFEYREYLARELKVDGLPFASDFERFVDDFVFMCFFVGNDFLPHLPSLEIREGAIDELLRIYKRVLPTLGGHLTEHGNVNLSRVDVLLSEVGALEDVVFRARKQQEEMQKKRELDNRARVKGLQEARAAAAKSGSTAALPVMHSASQFLAPMSSSSPSAAAGAAGGAYPVHPSRVTAASAAAAAAAAAGGQGQPRPPRPALPSPLPHAQALPASPSSAAATAVGAASSSAAAAAAAVAGSGVTPPATTPSTATPADNLSAAAKLKMALRAKSSSTVAAADAVAQSASSASSSSSTPMLTDSLAAVPISPMSAIAAKAEPADDESSSVSRADGQEPATKRLRLLDGTAIAADAVVPTGMRVSACAFAARRMHLTSESQCAWPRVLEWRRLCVE